MTFSFSLKKVMDQIFNVEIKSELEGDIEYYYALYYMSLLRKQYCESVMKQFKMNADPESITLMNCYQKAGTVQDPALRFHILMLGMENTIIKPLRQEIIKATGKTPENPFAPKTGSHGMPGLDPRRV